MWGKTENCFFNVKAVNIPTAISMGRDTSVRIATRYGMCGPGIEFR
jgi:hypothetical protein